MHNKLFAAAVLSVSLFAAEPVVRPGQMARVASVNERFGSYNIEMVEVTGGRFWAPYGSKKESAPAPGGAISAIDASAFRTRDPIDLSNARLRKLAEALGPAYVRVSGTWANSTYFHDSDQPPPSTPPTGFGGVLTRKEWRGVIDFATAVNAKIMTSFAVSGGVRDANGVWTPAEARKLVDFTKSAGGEIAAAELFNEPSFASIGGAPTGYTAADFGRDFDVFHAFARQAAPNMLVLGPGSVGEAMQMSSSLPMLKSEDMLKAMKDDVDAFSYHFYPAVSQRCGGMGGPLHTTPDAALSEEFLSRTDRDETFYAALRDRFAPGKPMWLTETGEAACGGNPWASGFIDSFRYLDQNGRLAKKGVQVIAHNTLAASDYGLIDESTLKPRPNYWAALLWNKLMGTTVLDAGNSPTGKVHLYAHCLRGTPGGVALLALNLDRDASHDLEIAGQADRYTLTARQLEGTSLELNGRELNVSGTGDVPALKGKRVRGKVALPAASITFFGFATAANPACQ